MIIATGGRDCVPFLKAAQATGFNKKVPFFMHTAAELATLRPVGKNAPEGVLGTSNYFFYYPDSAANKAFVKEFQDVYHRLPTVGALYGYITAQLITQAYQKTKSLDTEKFIDAVENATVQTPVGPVQLRAEDHQALLPMYMGVTKKSNQYDFLVAHDIVTIPLPRPRPTWTRS